MMTRTDKQPLRRKAQRTEASLGQTFKWITPSCPHCDGPLYSQVNEVTESDDGTDYASGVDVHCANAKCDATVHPNDTQSTWQPLIDRIVRTINRRYYFKRS